MVIILLHCLKRNFELRPFPSRFTVIFNDYHQKNNIIFITHLEFINIQKNKKKIKEKNIHKETDDKSRVINR